jgi:transposase InsO family protein
MQKRIQPLRKKQNPREEIGAADQLVLHADNGAPMKGATLLATLHKLGVVPSFSRPAVSDDNPYSEALFRTMKYRPDYPQAAFESLEQAQGGLRACPAAEPRPVDNKCSQLGAGDSGVAESEQEG